MTSATSPEPAPERTSPHHPLLWNGVVSGVISGALVVAAAVYRLQRGDNWAPLAFMPFIGVAWVAAAYRTARWTISARVGALAGLLAAFVATAAGAAANVLLHATTPDIVIGLVVPPLMGLLLGYVAGFVGMGRGARDLGDIDPLTQKTIDRPVIPAHRTVGSQKMDFPQTDKPTV